MQLDGLPPGLHAIADALWAAETGEQVEALIAEYGDAARLVRDLMVLEALDTMQAVGGEVEWLADDGEADPL